MGLGGDGGAGVLMETMKSLRKVIRRLHDPVEVMLICVRWYAAYPLSLRHIEEMIAKSAASLLITPRYTAGH